MVRLLISLSLLLALLLPALARATWLPDGNPVCAGCSEAFPVSASDGAGGIFVLWENGQILAQHLTADGNLAPGWPAGGLTVCQSPRGPYGAQVLPDGQGGFFATWVDGRSIPTDGWDIYAQHMLADGTPAPGWPTNGVPAIANLYSQGGGSSDQKMALDGYGGLLIVCDTQVPTEVLVQRLTATGVPASGWPLSGIVACNQTAIFPSVASDGAGGAFVAWRDFRRGGSLSDGTFDVYGLHLTATGAIGPGWTSNGNNLASGHLSGLLLADNAGGFYLASTLCSTVYLSDANYYLQRFTVDGVPVQGWPSAGVQVWGAQPNIVYLTKAILDPSGDVLLSWPGCTGGCNDYVSRVRQDGTLAPGWPADGLRVSDPLDPYADTVDLVADEGGGIYAAWQVYDGGADASYIQRLTGFGTVAPGWPQYGIRFASTCGQFTPEIVADGLGGAIVVWEEVGGICDRVGLFAQHFSVGGVVAVVVSLVSADADPERVELEWQVTEDLGGNPRVERRTVTSGWGPLGAPSRSGAQRLRFVDRSISPGTRYAYRLSYEESGQMAHSAESWVEVPVLRLALEGMRPNPSTAPITVAFTLPGAAPATLELLDIDGRRLVAREVGALGPGTHHLRLEESSAVRPGIYWLRLSQGRQRLIARAVIIS